MIKEVPELKYGMEILNILKSFGDVYIVGGCVRDLIMGKVPNDVDICTNIDMEKLEELFPTHDVGANKDFGIVIVEYKGYNYEISNFRNDGIYSDGRRPDDVQFVSTFEEDSKRRDFTMNSLAMDINRNILDYHNGIEDIKNKIIRTVGDPRLRFKEDYLRMLRAVRFSSKLGFNIHPETIHAIKDFAPYITSISRERITAEILKMADQSGKKFAMGIQTMYDCGLLAFTNPEIAIMNEFEHSKEHHPEGFYVRKIIN